MEMLVDGEMETRQGGEKLGGGEDSLMRRGEGEHEEMGSPRISDRMSRRKRRRLGWEWERDWVGKGRNVDWEGTER